jgi:hypothetical protein
MEEKAKIYTEEFLFILIAGVALACTLIIIKANKVLNIDQRYTDASII